MATGSERTQPTLVPKPEAFGAEDESRRLKATPVKRGAGGVIFATAAGALWICISCAYLAGYFGLGGLTTLTTLQIAVFASMVLIPPVLFLVTAWAVAKGLQLSASAEALVDATD